MVLARIFGARGLAAARAAGAKAILGSTTVPDVTVVDPGANIGIGVGGYSSSGGHGGGTATGGNVGIGFPARRNARAAKKLH